VTRNAQADGETGGQGDKAILRKLHQTIRKVTEDFDSRWHFNTSLAAIMELVNQLYIAEKALSPAAMREVLEKLVLLLGPFAPYVAEEMWEELGKAGPVFKQPWPDFDPELAQEDLAEVVVQINGKLRSRIHVPFGTAKDELERAALADEKVRSALAGKVVVKAILVPDRLVNIVAR
jgi:leucyl-tRNA synthetase